MKKADDLQEKLNQESLPVAASEPTRAPSADSISQDYYAQESAESGNAASHKNENQPQERNRAVQDWVNRLYSARIRLPMGMMLTAVLLILTCLKTYFFPSVLDEQTFQVISTLLWLVCILVSYDVLTRGLGQIFRLQLGMEALTVITSVLLAVNVLQNLSGGGENYCALGALQLTFALWGMRESWRAKLTTARTMDEQPLFFAACSSDSVWDGERGAFVAKTDAEAYQTACEKPGMPTHLVHILAPMALVLSAALAAALYLFQDCPFVKIWLLLLLSSTPLCGFVFYAKPYALLARTMAHFGAAIGGWQGAKTFRGRHTILLRDADLFPIQSVRLNGVKIYGTYPEELLLAYAAAATQASQSPLAPLFAQLCEERNCPQRHVQKYRYYNCGGIGAEIQGNVVLMGSLSFMNAMGIRKDHGMKMQRAIYLAVNGELACVFAVKYKVEPEIKEGLLALQNDGHFDFLLATRDFLITPEMMEEKFGISRKVFLYPDVHDRIALSQKPLPYNARQGALLCSGRFGTFAAATCCGRMLYGAITLGAALTVLTGAVGFAMAASLIAAGALSIMSTLNLTIFLLTWFLPELLFLRWTKKLCRRMQSMTQNAPYKL